MAELSKRVELVILEDNDGFQVVTERHHNELCEISTSSTLKDARAWVEAHYEGVEWVKTRLARALIGRLASRTDHPAGEDRASHKGVIRVDCSPSHLHTHLNGRGAPAVLARSPGRAAACLHP